VGVDRRPIDSLVAVIGRIGGIVDDDADWTKTRLRFIQQPLRRSRIAEVTFDCGSADPERDECLCQVVRLGGRAGPGKRLISWALVIERDVGAAGGKRAANGGTNTSQAAGAGHQRHPTGQIRPIVEDCHQRPCSTISS
jgi:hypothetical protein